MFWLILLIVRLWIIFIFFVCKGTTLPLIDCQWISTCKNRVVIDMLMTHAFRACKVFTTFFYSIQRSKISNPHLITKTTHFWMTVEICRCLFMQSRYLFANKEAYLLHTLVISQLRFFICTYFPHCSRRNLKLLYTANVMLIKIFGNVQ